MARPRPETTRFAPSPSGWLHLGHAYSACMGWDAARASGGRFLLRIDDLDRERSRQDYDDAIFEDLTWLGLDWEPEIRRESHHLTDYQKAVDDLQEMGVAYPCFCSRREIRAEIARMGAAPHGPEGPHYPGTCRGLTKSECEDRIAAGATPAIRLNTERALSQTGALTWFDRDAGTIDARPDQFGDPVIGRKEGPGAYHIAVVIDDAAQDVTLVTRGQDLFEASHLHRLLQELLQLPVPEYQHHRLILDSNGKRLAKRSDAAAIRTLRADGMSPGEVWALLGLSRPEDACQQV
ncbi:MAG: tRNA glutamyl-Q(34) synthetase GluQRS [Pseudomonadota bacterium]